MLLDECLLSLYFKVFSCKIKTLYISRSAALRYQVVSLYLNPINRTKLALTNVSFLQIRKRTALFVMVVYNYLLLM